MRCPVCGQSYGLTHNCAGVAPAPTADEIAPPSHSIPAVHYFLEAWRIAVWDDAAIRRVAADKNALLFGVLYWGLGAFALVAVPSVSMMRAEVPVDLLALAFGLVIGAAIAAAVTMAQYAVCHFAAKWFFHATGTYIGVLRPLLLGFSLVNLALLIPFVGIYVGGLWGIAILMFVFEEVDGIERMQAFGIAFVVGIAFRYLLALSLQRG